jgi:hypothetical protein
MSEIGASELLGAGGLSVDDLDALGGDGDLSGVPRFRALRSPRATDELGRWLAAEIAPLGPTRLVAWSGLDDTLLVFVISRELGCPVTVVWNDEGLLRSEPPLETGDRIVLVAESFRAVETLDAVRSLAIHRGATVAGSAALVATAVQVNTADAGEQAIFLFDRRGAKG